MAFERYRTARPEIVDALLTDDDVDGLSDVERLGAPVVNRPDVPMIDPTSLLDDRIGQPINPLTVIGVDDPQAGDQGEGRLGRAVRLGRRHRRCGRQRTARRLRGDPLQRVVDTRRTGASNRGRRARDRHRLEPRSGPPLAWIAGCPRPHRTRRPRRRRARADRVRSATRRSSPARTHRSRRSRCRTGRSGRGRRRTANRSPTVPRTVP